MKAGSSSNRSGRAHLPPPARDPSARAQSSARRRNVHGLFRLARVKHKYAHIPTVCIREQPLAWLRGRARVVSIARRSMSILSRFFKVPISGAEPRVACSARWRISSRTPPPLRELESRPRASSPPHEPTLTPRASGPLPHGMHCLRTDALAVTRLVSRHPNARAYKQPLRESRNWRSGPTYNRKVLDKFITRYDATAYLALSK